MNRTYCVFWIPCNSHTKIEIKQKYIDPFCISSVDNHELIEHNVRLQLENSENHNNLSHKIIISSTNSKTNEQASLSLSYEKDSRNGFLVYSYDKITEDASHELKFIYSNLPYRIYHHIKNFFHLHQYHQKEDGIFEAYSVDSYPCIQKNDSEIFKHYFICYLNRFRSIYKKLNEYIINDIKNASIDERLRMRRKINDDCGNLFGEEIYYRTLSYSRYNISGHSTLVCSNVQAFDYDLHRIAIEIENVLIQIHLLYENNQFALTQEIVDKDTEYQATMKEVTSNLREAQVASDRLATTSNKTGWLGVWVGAVGLIVGLVGIYFSNIQPLLFPTKQERQIDRLIKIQEHQQQQIKIINNEVNNRGFQIDSLSKHLKNTIVLIERNNKKIDNLGIHIKNTVQNIEKQK